MEPIGEASERALPPAPPGTEAWNEPVEVSEALKRKMGFSPPPPHPDDYGERSR
jgi:hypothetical protein